MSEDLNALQQSYPGRATFITTISTFALARSPSFIHVHDPFTFQQTRTLLSEVLPAVARQNTLVRHTIVDCALCFTPKLLFTSVLNGLAEFKPTWADGYRTWTSNDDAPIDGTDSFLHGLRNILGGGRGGGTQQRGSAVIVFVNPESMRFPQQNMTTTMTRLAELVCLQLMIIGVIN
jgi:origin recognition complex subunit 5